MSQAIIDSTPLIREQWLQAPPATVWKAISDKQSLKSWSFDIPDFEPIEGQPFHFYGEKDGLKFLHACRVIEIKPLVRMKWLWAYEGIQGDTYVTFEITPDAEGTLLRVTHEGLHHLPQDEHYARNNFEAGWTSLISDLLPKYLATQS